jgi:GT2 family glycosyltransferase
MSYLMVDQEIASLPSELAVPQPYRGAGLVLRQNRCVVAFVLWDAARGRSIQTERLKRELQPQAMRSPEGDGSPKLPSLTIAIATRNRPLELARGLQSLLALPGKDSVSEYIVVDNAPDDNRTAETVARFPQVRYLVEPRRGLSAARNCAIRAAKGEIIIFTDDDTVPDQNWIGGLATAVRENPGAVAFSGPMLPLELETEAQILVEGRGGLGRALNKTLYTSTLAGSRTYPCGEACFGGGANMAFRRSVFEKIGLFDEALGAGTLTRAGEDTDMFYRVIRAGLQWAYEPQMLLFHQHCPQMEELRKRVESWGCANVASMMKYYRTDPENRKRIVRFVLRLVTRKVGGVVASALHVRRYRWPVQLAWAELQGVVAGFTAYSRALSQRTPAESVRLGVVS